MTVSQASFDDTVAGFYRAAAGSIGWKEALVPFQRALSAFAVYFHGVDLARGSVAFSHTAADFAPDMEIDYIRTYHRIDPRAGLSMRQAPGEWMNCWDHFDDAYVADSRFYQEFLIPYGGRYVSGTEVFRDDTLSVMMGIHRGIGSEPLDASEIAVGQRLATHLKQAFLLHRDQVKLQRENRLGVELLAQLRAPVALLNEQRQILHANPSAQSLLEGRNAVVERGGRLHCVRPEDDDEFLVGLLRLLEHDAAKGDAAVDKVFLQARSPSGDQPIGLYLSALRPQETLHAFGDRPLVMVVLHEPSARVEHDPFVVAAAFDLSPAEARVAIAIAEGHRPEAIARKHFVAVSTVRTQLRHVFEKTNTSRQTQLVGVLASLPTAGLKCAAPPRHESARL